MKRTILIIEDDIIFSRSISNWLRKNNMETECVAQLSSARRKLSSGEYDLVLADLRLPDGLSDFSHGTYNFLGYFYGGKVSEIFNTDQISGYDYP